tara:strand:+ start:1531 stop:2154 length:624 start_codon:yes stop_codon:yes gene_type:complete
MANQLNSGTLDTLKPNETLLLQARKVANGKIQLEVAESIQVSDRPMNVLGMLNKSDDRFKSNARRTWITAEPTDATELFGINFGADAEWYMGTSKSGAQVELLDLNVLNPVINDMRCRILVTETIEPTDWQAENVERAAKRRGAEGEFITHDSNYIFSNTTLVLTNEDTKSMHTFLKPDSVAMQTGDNTTSSVATVLETATTENIDL